MTSFSANTGAAVFRYSMARAWARAATLYCELGSSAARATDPGSKAARTAPTATAPAPRRIGWRRPMRSLPMRSDPQVGGEDLLLAELVGFAHELDPALVE